MSEPTTFSEFTYAPGPVTPPGPTPPPPPPVADLGPLAGLSGSWHGSGFNAIWRPVNGPQDRFLELNLTNEDLDFDDQGLGTIPNRGFLQGDLFMGGLRYLQRISDANLNEGLHIEPGLWLTIPATTAPAAEASVARLASIPHGTTIVAQGASTTIDGPPSIAPVNLNPFTVGDPSSASPFSEQDLSVETAFRTPAPGLVGIGQAMVDNPNSVLEDALTGQTISRTVALDVTTANAPILGGGTANTAFLQGDPAGGPNADAAVVSATFWIETIGDAATPSQLQYSQTVLLDFNGLSWPHVTVATLTKVA